MVIAPFSGPLVGDLPERESVGAGGIGTALRSLGCRPGGGLVDLLLEHRELGENLALLPPDLVERPRRCGSLGAAPRRESMRQ
jgi:hypothetical protein